MLTKVDGKFSIVFRGTLLLFVSKSVLTSEKGSVATVYSVHIIPLFAFGFVIQNKK